MFTLQQLQEEHSPWVLHNFHQQEEQHSYAPFEGIVEELGELQIGGTYDEVIDAIGDVMIFMSDFASCMGIKLSEVSNGKSRQLSNEELIVALGRLAHAHLKLMQNIRAPREIHMIEITTALQMIIMHLRGTLAAFCRAYKTSETLESVCEQIWQKVRQRDWKRNAMTGGV